MSKKESALTVSHRSDAASFRSAYLQHPLITSSKTERLPVTRSRRRHLAQPAVLPRRACQPGLLRLMRGLGVHYSK